VNVAILAETKDLGFDAEIAVASVVEGVVLEAAGGGEVKAEVGETRLESLWIVDWELQFDLGSLHRWSIRLGADSRAIEWRYVQWKNGTFVCG
jgi:hypothetical protein